MKSFTHARVLPAIALSVMPFLCVPARAQTARSIYLFNSSFGRGPGVVQDAYAGTWGNGTSNVARRVDYEGAPSLQVTTRSFVEGVRFELRQPIDPAPYINNGFVRLRVKFREIGGGGGGIGGGDPRGGGGDPRGGGGDPRAGFRGLGELVPRWEGAAQFDGRERGMPGMGDPRGFGGEGGAPMGPLPQTTFIKELKITLVREQGVMSGRLKINLRARDNQPDDNGWRLYTLSLKNMTSTPGASGAIRRVVLTSDAQDTFNLAQMALVVETGQMTASLRTPAKTPGTQVADIEWKPGVPLTLVADVEAGAADPQVEWNFDADNVGNLPAPAVNGGMTPDGMSPDGRGGDPRMGGMMDPRGMNRDPRGQLGMGGGGGRDPREMGGQGGMGEGGMPAFVGPRIDARGLTATFTYPNEEQNYRVEVTVRDRSNSKPPVKTSILVRIRG